MDFIFYVKCPIICASFSYFSYFSYFPHFCSIIQYKSSRLVLILRSKCFLIRNGNRFCALERVYDSCLNSKKSTNKPSNTGKKMTNKLKNYFITGLLIWIPLGVTIWVLQILISSMDRSILLLPPQYRPAALFGMDIPGMGVVVTLGVVLFTGLFGANFLGRKVVLLWEGILQRIPVVKSIYSSVKQVSDTLFSSQGQAFRKAVLVRFPHSEALTVAFLEGEPSGELADHLHEYLSVFVPTTPNPTSGYLIIVPREQVIELEMSVDEALKYVISMGVVPPNQTKNQAKKVEN